MPQKNALKPYLPDTYYHVYARGINKGKIFLDAQDYSYFLSLFSRYLSTQAQHQTKYPIYRDRISLVCYCLMSNHFHLLLHQTDNQDLPDFMRSLMTSYVKYFNLKYKRVGALFESRYKARPIGNDSYLVHISRYIHMNPQRWQTYRHSSLPYIFDAKKRPEWLTPGLIIDEFGSQQNYVSFLHDYQENKDELEKIKHDLADQ